MRSHDLAMRHARAGLARLLDAARAPRGARPARGRASAQDHPQVREVGVLSMPIYTPPLRDQQFVLHEVLGAVDALRRMPHYAELDVDTVNQVVEEAGKFCAEQLLPINQSGDAEGCAYDARNACGEDAGRLQAGLRSVPRGGLARAGGRCRVRRPGPAAPAAHRVLRDAVLDQPGLGDVPGPDARRLRVPAGVRHAESRRSFSCPSWSAASGPARCA